MLFLRLLFVNQITIQMPLDYFYYGEILIEDYKGFAIVAGLVAVLAFIRQIM